MPWTKRLLPKRGSFASLLVMDCSDMLEVGDGNKDNLVVERHGCIHFFFGALQASESCIFEPLRHAKHFVSALANICCAWCVERIKGEIVKRRTFRKTFRSGGLKIAT